MIIINKYNEFKKALRNIITKSQDFSDFFRNVKTIEDTKKEFRKELQMIVNKWARDDGHTHPPVYISYKPKISLSGLYFSKYWTGGIVIFVLRSSSYPCDLEDLEVAEFDEIMDTLRHEYIHHILRNIGCDMQGQQHTPFFYKILKERFAKEEK